MPTFWDLQLFTLVSRWFQHFTGPKNAPWVCFGRFSSRVKRCRHTGMHRFTRELKRPKQTQGAFLGPLKCSNHLETKVKSCRSQKVGIEKWRRFFDSMRFTHAQCPLVGFICRKELLQQNGPQGQNYFWFTVSKTCSDFLGELVTSFFLLKWTVMAVEISGFLTSSTLKGT